MDWFIALLALIAINSVSLALLYKEYAAGRLPKFINAKTMQRFSTPARLIIAGVGLVGLTHWSGLWWLGPLFAITVYVNSMAATALKPI